MAEKRTGGRKPTAGKARDGKPAGGSVKVRAKSTSARRKSPITSGKTAKRANAAARKAKAAGATGRRLNAVKQGMRDSMIVARVAQGVRYDMIAAEAGVSVSTVEKVVAQTRGVRSALDRSPAELLEGLSRGFELSIGDFEAMAAAFIEASPGDAIRAKRAANEARKAHAELMRVVGKLPTDLELFRSEVQMQQLGERMVEMMARVVAGDETPEAAYELFRELTLRPRELAAGTSADVESTAVEIPEG